MQSLKIRDLALTREQVAQMLGADELAQLDDELSEQALRDYEATT